MKYTNHNFNTESLVIGLRSLVKNNGGQYKSDKQKNFFLSVSIDNLVVYSDGLGVSKWVDTFYLDSVGILKVERKTSKGVKITFDRNNIQKPTIQDKQNMINTLNWLKSDINDMEWEVYSYELWIETNQKEIIQHETEQRKFYNMYVRQCKEEIVQMSTKKDTLNQKIKEYKNTIQKIEQKLI